MYAYIMKNTPCLVYINSVMAAKKSKYYEMCYIIHTIGNLTVFC